MLRVPADTGVDPIGRMVAATGVPADELSLPAPNRHGWRGEPGSQSSRPGKTSSTWSTEVAKDSTTWTLRRRTSAIELVETLPARSQIALGGAPSRKASWRKSESFDALVVSARVGPNLLVRSRGEPDADHMGAGGVWRR